MLFKKDYFASLFTREGFLALGSRFITRAISIGIGQIVFTLLYIWLGRLAAWIGEAIGGLVSSKIDYHLHKSIYADNKAYSGGRRTRWTGMTFIILKVIFIIPGASLFYYFYESKQWDYFYCQVTTATIMWVLTHFWFERLLSGREEDLPDFVRIVRKWIIKLKNKPRATMLEVRDAFLKRIRYG